MYLMVFFVLVLEGLGGGPAVGLGPENVVLYGVRSEQILPISNDDLNCVFCSDMCPLGDCSVIAVFFFSPYFLGHGVNTTTKLKTSHASPNLIRLRLVLVKKFSLALLGLQCYALYPRFLLDDHNIYICTCTIQSHHISHFVTSITTSMSGRDCGRECQTRRIAAAPHGKTSPCYPE